MTLDTRRRTLLTGGALALAATVGPPRGGGDAAAQGAPPVPRQRVPGSADTPLSVIDFGAIADGYLHPLSERFGTLTQAREVYPFATALDQTLDWAAIQAAVDAARGRRNRQVHLPAGRYVIAHSVRLPNGIDLYGDGASTIVDNEVIALKVPQFVNADPSLVGIAIRDMSLRGGSHALKIDVPTGEVAWLFMDGVACAFQTDKNIECDRLLQSSNFNNCGFTHSPFGVFVAGHTTNAVNFFNCTFEQHSRTHLHLRGAEGVNVHGGKFEGSGPTVAPPGERHATIFLENAGAINFHGVYFESTHEVLLQELHSRGGVSFQGCHFTGAKGPTGPIPYRFVSDGLVTFGTNDWYLPSEGPARILLQGYNGQKLAAEGAAVETTSWSPRDQRMVSGARTLSASGILPLATITRIGTLARGTALLSGQLVLHGTVPDRAGGTALLSRRYHLRIHATPAGTTGRIEATATLDDPGIDLTIRLRVLDAELSTVEAVLRSLGDTGGVNAEKATLQWSLEALAMAAPGGARLEMDIPAIS